MFRAFGRSFLDVFRYPLLLLYGFLFYILSLIITFGFVELFYDTLFIEGLSITGLILYWVTQQLWIVLLFFILFFMLFYFLSMFVAYIYNKLLGAENRFVGKEKIFGFGIFIFFVFFLNIIFFFITSNWLVLIIYFIFIFFCVLFLIPYLFVMPVLLVEYDLKTALSESFKFAKEKYFSILGFLVLFILVSNLIFLGIDYLDLIIPNLTFIAYIFVTLIFMMWQIYFVYELYHN
jgi:hypothetical protein